MAEDLRNGEFSYPIILALSQPEGNFVAKALESRTEKDFEKALAVVQSDPVKSLCLRELKQVGADIRDFVEIWGRKERLDAETGASA